MDALDCILSRRSCRQYLPDAVPCSLLEQVVEAGRHAPSGGNNQSFHFLVVTDPSVLGRLASMAAEAFAALEATEGMYPSLAGSIRAAKRGGYVFHYHAPALVIVANRLGYSNAMADSSCALENMMLAATALGLGSCWINQLRWLDSASGMTGTHPEMDAYLHSLGLGEEEQVCGAVSLGFPAQSLPADHPRRSAVTWI